MSDSTPPINSPEKIDYKRVGFRRTAWIILTSYAPLVALFWFLVSLSLQQRGVHERTPLDLAAGGLTRLTFVSPRDERLAVRVTQKNALRLPQLPNAFSVFSCQITVDGTPLPLSSLIIDEPSLPESGRLDLAEFAVRKGQSCEVEVTTLQPLFSYAAHKPQLQVVRPVAEDEPFPIFEFVRMPAIMVFTFFAIHLFRGRMLAAQRIRS